MDSYEATRIVYSKIQILDPENASKIMGLLLIQDHGEKEMIRLAFGPESLLQSFILNAKNDLGITTNPVSSRFGMNLTIPSSDDHLISPRNLSLGSPCFGAPASNLIDDFQLQDQLSFLDDGSPATGVQNSDLVSPTGGGFGSYGGGGPVHRRSVSVNDACLGTEDLNCGLGWKPCLYYARGFCKNGSGCRFLHGGDDGGDSPELCHELLRSKSSVQHQQRLQLSNSFPYSPKSITFLLQQQQTDSPRSASATTALMLGDELQKFNRFSFNSSAGIVNPASRQIYLTFPADSTFKEEDVSSYFSIYGPVQDVRIPYQQKRMFGFVTFVYPETVKLILAKGNPHFVCDARVLVKPYKEKGKVPDKFRKQQQIDRDFSPCGTPTGLDSRELYERMFYNSQQDLLWRRKLEEQQAELDLQSRRLLNLQLLDVKKKQFPHHYHHRALSTGSPIPSPTHSPNPFAQNLIFPTVCSTSSCSNSDIFRENGAAPVSVSTETPRQPSPVSNDSSSEFFVVNDKERSQIEDSDLLECFEHNLPDNLFASPAKSTNKDSEPNDSDGTTSILASTSSLDVAAAPFKSYNCQLPRFPSGHGAIGMYAGTGGPTCPVGI